MADKVEATGYNGPEVSDEEGRATVQRALAAMHDLDAQLNTQAVMDRADEIVAAYNERVKNQLGIINRLIDQMGVEDSAKPEIERLLDMIQNRDVRIAYLEKQLKKARRDKS